jgi:hypothetical protein
MYRFFAAAAVVWACTPVAPAADLKGFPFTDESLRYTVNWPSGLSLGDIRLQAQHTGPAWRFTLTINAGVPGFTVKDTYTSNATTDLCSTSFERDTQHGSKHSRERETVDAVTKEVKRTTVDGGESTLTAPACVKDALTLLFFARRELGQGKVPPSQQFLFGGLYQMTMTYSGAQKIQVGEQLTDSDKVVCTIKGPASDFQFEAFYARDAARTPLVIRVPLSSGRFSMELVR